MSACAGCASLRTTLGGKTGQAHCGEGEEGEEDVEEEEEDVEHQSTTLSPSQDLAKTPIYQMLSPPFYENRPSPF